MEKFCKIYPFTTENIKGYLNDLELNDKKVITVLGSSDHIINLILKGCKHIYCFDINKISKYYLDLKLNAIKNLTYEEFKTIFLDKGIINKEILNKIKLNEEAKKFWNKSLINDEINIFNSLIFNKGHYTKENIIKNNLYFNKENYDIIKEKINDVKIIFENKNLLDLKIEENYDYMFLSNISDYLSNLYESNELENYYELINKFKKNVNTIYFAYLYDYGNKKPRSRIDDLNEVKKVFKTFEVKIFKSALVNIEKNIIDAVLIIKEE